MRRLALPYRALSLAAAAVTASACTPDIDDFVNLGTESVTEGLTEAIGDSTTGEPSDDSTTGAGDSTTAEPASSTGAAEDESSSGGAAASSSGGDDFGQFCGDGVISGTEDCDCGGGPCTPEGLGDATCLDAEDPLLPGPLTGGVLGCNPASCQFDTTLCTYCGDEEINGIENCEVDMDITETCMSLGKGSVGDLTCGENCVLDTSGCTECGAEFDFDDCGEDGWFTIITHGSATNPPSWECGLASGSGGPGATGETVWGTNLDGEYFANESAALRSPEIDLTLCAEGETVEMRVTHWFEFEGFILNSDGGIVQVSDDGFSWETLDPIAGASYSPEDLTTSFNPPDGQPGFSGNSEDTGTWVESVFDVSEFAGATNLQVRFVFGSDGGNQEPGWYIDRVEFVGGGK